MSSNTLIGLIVGFASLILAFTLEGGKVGSLLQVTAAMIVFGGTIGAVIVSFPNNDIKRIPSIFKLVFKKPPNNSAELIDFFKDIVIKIRKNGLLSIEEDILKVENKFIKKGLQLIVDGVEPEMVKNIMETDADAAYERHKSGIAIFEAAGGFGPTMGIIGTVMGLVHVLSNLDDPKSLGPKIAVAFIATLYGVGSANLLWLPIANKLKVYNKLENSEYELIIEGILGLQGGLNPNTLVEKLRSYLPKDVAKSSDIAEMDGKSQNETA